jgi:hypothetical protein
MFGAGAAGFLSISALLTILFSALLSFCALRFLLCSSGSAHFTDSRIIPPSTTCFSSKPDIAYNAQHT